jgi:hypothetical protein
MVDEIVGQPALHTQPSPAQGVGYKGAQSHDLAVLDMEEHTTAAAAIGAGGENLLQADRSII